MNSIFQVTNGRLSAYFLTGMVLLAIVACRPGHQARTSPEPPGSIASEKFKKGIASYQNGDYANAIVLFKDAADLFQREKDLCGRCESLTRLAHVFLSQGRTENAFKVLGTAENIAQKLNSAKKLAGIYALFGNLNNLAGNAQDGLNDFQKSISLCRQNNYPDLLISVLNDMGNLYAACGQYENALEAYMKSAGHAKEKNLHARSAIALANAAKVCIKQGDKYQFENSVYREIDTKDGNGAKKSSKDSEIKHRRENLRGTILYSPPKDMHQSTANRLYVTAESFLDQAWAGLEHSNSSHIINTLVNIGTGYMDLAERQTESMDDCIKKARKTFLFAESLSQNIKNTRLASYVKGYLGHTYQMEGDFNMAAALTFQAIFLSRKSAAPEAQYRWEWQYADILKALNHIRDAIPAYEAAIDTLESVRSEFSNCYGRPQSEMGALAGQLYKMYVDVLLRFVSTQPSSDEKQIILKRARQAIEKNRVFEIREYFNDDCLGAHINSLTDIDQILEKAVVVYPIILPDRIAVVASFPSQTGPGSDSSAVSKLYLQPIDAKTLSQTVDGFRHMIERNVMPPDLTDARKLYEWLIAPLEKDLADVHPETLVFVPGGILRGIPMGALHDGSSFLIESYAVAVTPGLTLTSPTKIAPEKINVLAAGISSGNQDFGALPGVTREVEAIASLCTTTVLMNDKFSLTNFENELRSGNYNVVHIASHGKFSDHIEDSFILTADERLTFNKLADCVGLYRFRKNPLELITLSACETASGNEQAALGLAGLSIKIGARSALATLWAVDDAAAAQLVPEFYRQLKIKGTSRAMALKQAKLKLLRDPVYGHPGYWAPFILINNWL
nr:CHAT domain-containing protein [uncultured Desulfobacter sp.]